MDNRRYELQNILENILGSQNVYFQPPESIRIEYPAIIYNRSNLSDNYANDSSYSRRMEYNVILIDRNPDSEFIEKIVNLPFCRFDRHYTSDNLNHDVFTLYY